MSAPQQPFPPPQGVSMGMQMQMPMPAPGYPSPAMGAPMFVQAMDPREIFTNLSALHVMEDNVGFATSSFRYMVTDYSAGVQGRPLFSGAMDEGFFGIMQTAHMALYCLAITDQNRTPLKFLEITKSGFDRTCTVSYVLGPQPMFLGMIIEECGCCGPTLSVVDTVTRRLLYYIKYKTRCCRTYEFSILDPIKAEIGSIHVVSMLKSQE